MVVPNGFDIIDDFSVFSRQGDKRVKFYKKNKYTIENINMDSRPKLQDINYNFESDSDEE